MALIPPLRSTDEFDYGNARFLAIACSLLVRGPLDEVAPTIKKVLGLSGSAVGVGQVRAFVGSTADRIIVVTGVLSI